jgi:hypothetical protein
VALHTVQNTLAEYFSPMFDGNDEVLQTAFLAAFYVAWALVLAARLGPTLGERFQRPESDRIDKLEALVKGAEPAP